ncbi:ZIP family metal transporter [Rubrobacter calidifluminis]|uniref:ZIP family metal transporter n=1 Tax=Rubrobacter calidifluminis TaxID=1392640 RepID=UPI00236140F8|nr:ZIP family metal transporter [Rubrobacter calidifluminis]
MNAVFAASLAGAGFCGASLFGLLGGRITQRARASLLAFAAGIILALAFADLLPESVEAAGPKAIACFATAFALMALLEGLHNSHHRHDEADTTRSIGSEGATLLLPFVIGFALHNLAEGFVVAAGAGASAVAVGGIGIGVMVHKIPEGGSLGAVLAGSGTSRAKVAVIAFVLGLVVPVAAGLTLFFSSPGESAVGMMSGTAGGVLCYLGASHLLPEARERGGREAGVVFAGSLLCTVVLLFTLLSD